MLITGQILQARPTQLTMLLQSPLVPTGHEERESSPQSSCPNKPPLINMAITTKQQCQPVGRQVLGACAAVARSPAALENRIKVSTGQEANDHGPDKKHTRPSFPCVLRQKVSKCCGRHDSGEQVSTKGESKEKGRIHHQSVPGV